MVVIIVILTVLIFIVVDFALRTALKRREETRLKAERAAALDTALRLDFTEEAPSLTRVEVDQPKARILAVDDEPIVLESFRKILVMEGYSVDTVESAREAVGLVRKHDYDFVYTDLKMPDMDGLELTKAIRHLRPDIDVVMITGYGTIESAVETMRFGAMDYVEKPFTADELADFTRKCLIRRQDRIEAETAPTIQLVTGDVRERPSPHTINVPGGIFVSPAHTWVNIGVTGEARVGLDDFALKVLTGIDEIEFPDKDSRVIRGAALFSVRRGDQRLTFPSPLTGHISKVHHELIYQLELLPRRPLMLGWICALEPENLTAELTALRIGADSVAWYEKQVVTFWRGLHAADEAEAESWKRTWVAFGEKFLGTDKTAEVLV